MMHPDSVLIVAGGNSRRFDSGLPKQFHLIHGKPVLLYALEAFYHTSDAFRLFVALPSEWMAYWQGLCDELGVRIPFTLTPGGRSRFESVTNALPFIGKEGLIAVHDAARALVSTTLISRCFEDARHYGSAVPVIPVSDTVRERNESGSNVIDREKLLLVQTPQIFRASVLHQACALNPGGAFTDEAACVEAAGGEIHLTEGDPLNIKITYPHELKLATALLTP